MKRRGFLVALGISGLAVGTNALAGGGAETDAQQYRGYAIRWTGWNRDAGSSQIAGQWLAVSNDPGMPMLFTSVPGSHGTYRKGNYFNLAVQVDDGQIYIDETTPKEEQEKQRQLGFNRIRTLIDETVG